jgi:hypothetical protein
VDEHELVMRAISAWYREASKGWAKHPTALFPDPTVNAVEKYVGEDYVMVRARGQGNEESPVLLTAYRVHNGKLRKVTSRLPREMTLGPEPE